MAADAGWVSAVAAAGGVAVTMLATSLRGRQDKAQQIIDGHTSLTDHWQEVAQDNEARLIRAETAIATITLRAAEAEQRAFVAAERAYRAEQHAITCDASLASLKVEYATLAERVNQLEK